jgi:hypothetical protein
MTSHVDTDNRDSAEIIAVQEARIEALQRRVKELEAQNQHLRRNVIVLLDAEKLGLALARLSDCVTIGAPSIIAADKLELAQYRAQQWGLLLANVDKELRALLDIPRPDHNCHPVLARREKAE